MATLLTAVLEAIFTSAMPAGARVDGPVARLRAWLGTPYSIVLVALWMMTGAYACEAMITDPADLWQPFLIAPAAAFMCGLLLLRPQPRPAAGALVSLIGPLTGIAAAAAGKLLVGLLPDLPGW